MGLYTELFYATISLLKLVFILFAVLLSLHLHTFLMFFTLVIEGLQPIQTSGFTHSSYSLFDLCRF